MAGNAARKTCCRRVAVCGFRTKEPQLLDRCRQPIKLGHWESDIVSDVSQVDDFIPIVRLQALAFQDQSI